MALTFDDLYNVDTTGLGVDFNALLNTGVSTVKDLETQRRAAQIAAANARGARAAAAAEDARTRAIIAGNAPRGLPVGQLAAYAGVAVLGSFLVIKLLRRRSRR